jgi:hypothetical protein
LCYHLFKIKKGGIKMKWHSYLLSVAIATIFTMSCSMDVKAQGKIKKFMPENTLYLQDNHFVTNITQDEFNAMLDRVESHYKPIIEARGKTFTLIRKWEDSTVNAYAQQQGNNWMVTMFGGMARRSEMNAAGFALVACHEVGHHLGGYPTYASAPWAANEGQSDYFSTVACAKKIFGDLDAGTINSNAKAKCEAKYSDPAKKNACFVSVSAGQSLGNLLGNLGGTGFPNYDTPDKSVKKADEHPKAQCRLDTYLAGALCDQPWVDSLIPTDMSGTCNTRPKCWSGDTGQTSDDGSGQPQPEPTPTPTPDPSPTDLFGAVNAKRVQVGTVALKHHAVLECAAKILADNAAKSGTCSMKDGLNVQQRIRLCGCDWMLGESRQAMGCYYADSKATIEGWYAEKNMKQYFTSNVWRRLGCAQSGSFYVCTFNTQP